MNYQNKGADNVFIFAHHPLTKLNIADTYFTFNVGEYDILANYLDYYKLHVELWAAGHLHCNRIYNIKTSENICSGHETAALKNAPAEGPGGDKDGTVIHTDFNSKIFRVFQVEHRTLQSTSTTTPTSHPRTA